MVSTHFFHFIVSWFVDQSAVSPKDIIMVAIIFLFQEVHIVKPDSQSTQSKTTDSNLRMFRLVKDQGFYGKILLSLQLADDCDYVLTDDHEPCHFLDGMSYNNYLNHIKLIGTNQSFFSNLQSMVANKDLSIK